MSGPEPMPASQAHPLEPEPARRVGRYGPRVAGAGAWLACALAMALGGAGIVTGVGAAGDGGLSRPELTYADDAVALPRLRTAADELARIRDEVDRLGTFGRGALAATIGGDQPALDQAIADGQALADQIARDAEALRARLASVPGTGGATSLPLPADVGLRLGLDAQRRYAEVLVAVAATDGLSGAWQALTSGSAAARQLSAILDRHDASTLAAARLGREAKYAAAVRLLDQSDAAIADARVMRDRLAPTVDVSTLDEWLQLFTDYDASLRTLYATLQKTRGRVTAAVRTAFAAEQAAHDRLPGDTRALIVIMGDIAKGGLNQAVVTIEQAKEHLDDALGALAEIDASPGPGAAASASTGP